MEDMMVRLADFDGEKPTARRDEDSRFSTLATASARGYAIVFTTEVLRL